LLGLAAAATVPVVKRSASDEEVDDEEDGLTLERSLLDTSEEERKIQTYGINQDRSIFYRVFRRIKIAFLRYIYEPIATGLRFVQLVIIFVPVLVTIPVIFIGPRMPESDNERAGTLWWYRFLVKQMERAGATFIKVIILNPLCFRFPWGFPRIFIMNGD
jgi:aarF domain-containing kinase